MALINLESLASYAHRALADTAYPDAGSLLTPVRANQMPLINTGTESEREGLTRSSTNRTQS